MAKTLKQMLEVYAPKSKDEKKFMDKHITAKSKLDDRGTQDDNLFKATNIKAVSRETEHGYNPGNDEKVYEEMSKLHPMALHVKDAGKGKYKVHAVGKHLSDGIKVGEHLSDSELDDAKEMGAKIKELQEDILAEGEVAAKQFQHYHNESSKLLKGIQKGLSDHYDNVTSKKNYNQGEPHWGHVGDIKDMHRSLQDIHDRILQTGEYTKPVSMREEAEQLTEDEELTQLLNTIYETLSDENKEIFEQILEEDPDQMIEFLEQLELESDNG